MEEVLRQISCSGKQGWTSLNEAKRAARRLRTAFRSLYQCRYCGQWHMGHNKKKPFR